MTLGDAVAVAQIVESSVTALGILAAGTWALFHFRRKRERYPRASVTHSTHQLLLPDGRLILRLTATVRNTGDVLLPITEARTWVQQLCPVPERVRAEIDSPSGAFNNGRCEFDWPLLGEREWNVEKGRGEIEPGEEQQLCGDFVLNRDVEQILIYTYVTNNKKPKANIGWSDSVVVELRGD